MKIGALTLEEAKQSKFRHVITKSIGFERSMNKGFMQVRALINSLRFQQTAFFR